MKRPSGHRILAYVFFVSSVGYVAWNLPRELDKKDVERENRDDWERRLTATKERLDHLSERDLERNQAEPISPDTNGTVPEGTNENRRTTPKSETTENSVRIMIQSRFRTGSTITERYFTKNPDFFGVHEPGGMLQRSIGAHIMEESRERLEKIKDELLGFMHDIFHCNFSSHDYFFYGLNNMPYYLFRAYLTNLKKPVTDQIITPVCRERPHKIIKVCRLFSILDAERLIREDGVKVIFLVRDPRGMAASRMAFTNLYTPEENFQLAANGSFRLSDRLENVVIQYCEWLLENYIEPTGTPEWLQGRYLMIRYEDMENNRLEVVRQLYDFVGLSVNDAIVSDLDKGNNAQRWRKRLRIDEVIRVQELCGKATFDKFGYKFANTEEELLDENSSLVVDWFDT
ncbi:carbohydrate sulfotransferase 1-like [Ptychodera flava]|uniref:carbohydrate sulfotransferase 1-like n=1 Tax=Ptychodera flava TaxID=63121 RepID=UPI003969DDB6